MYIDNHILLTHEAGPYFSHGHEKIDMVQQAQNINTKTYPLQFNDNMSRYVTIGNDMHLHSMLLTTIYQNMLEFNHCVDFQDHIANLRTTK